MSPGILLQEKPPDQSYSNSTEDSQDTDEPIAICGLSLKFPQEAISVEAFWEMLVEKRTAMTEFPKDRLNIDAFYDPNRQNTLCTRGGHFIKDDISLFDADFFSVSPSEAAALDPQQRLLLEVTFEALESAGVRLEDIRGSRTSVLTGCFSSDYLQQLLKDAERLPPYAAVGASQSMLANRLSWFFDLRGPSLNFDSACSSSAIAVDYSCEMLRRGQTDMGIAAGCNLVLDPDYSTILSNMQMLSPDGRCYTFDHRANGYSRGDGIGVVVLKRLSDALRDNDTIRAIIRSSGSNQDGRTVSITQPDSKAHARLIRETYRKAGLSMRHTRFFEAHGTGTAIGDPNEVSAIADCFQEYRSASDPLYVGAVKTNIGHLGGASGIAGLIKAVLVVEFGVIPPNANFERINPRLASYGYCIDFPAECIAWPPCEVRRASINSFGYGGANCHIIIDDVRSYLQRYAIQGCHQRVTGVNPEDLKASIDMTLYGKKRPSELDDLPPSLETPKLFVWSAASETSLKHMVSRWNKYCSRTLSSINSAWIANVAYTLDSRRSSLPWKAYAVISTLSEVEQLKELVSEPRLATTHIPRLAFIFTGQGAQWHAMGRELFAYPIFMRTVKGAAKYLADLGCEWSVEEELLKNEKETNIHSPLVSQVLTTVIQIGLVDLLDFFAVRPVAVVGHSMGEIAAAYCTGFLPRESALKIAYYRGIHVASILRNDSKRGAMLAVSLSAAELEPYFELLRKENANFDLVISCINSPVNTTVSGEERQIEGLRLILHDKGVFARRLKVAVAYHSPQMNQIAANCLKSFRHLKTTNPSSNVKMISSVTGTLLTRNKACEPDYWVSNLISPVLFSQAIGRLCQDSMNCLQKKLDGSHHNAIVVDHLIEIGPHAALRLPVHDTLSAIPRGPKIRYMSTLHRRRSAFLTIMELLGNLYCSGLPVDLRRINDPNPNFHDTRTFLADSPTYPFEHTVRYWSESPLNRNYRLRPQGHVELLGSPSRDWNPLEPQWRCCVRISEMTWLLDHKLNGRAIYPASAMIVMAVEAVSQLFNTQEQKLIGFTLRKVRFNAPIVIESNTTDLETRLRLKQLKSRATASSRWSFSVFSSNACNWVENCCGTIEGHVETEISGPAATRKSQYYRDCWDAAASLCEQEIEPTAVYKNFDMHGFHYGPCLQGITMTRHNGSDQAITRLSLANPLKLSPLYDKYIIHPASLDSFMQLALVSLSRGGTRNIPTQAISVIDKLEISSEGLQTSSIVLLASARFESETQRNKLYSAFAMSEDKKNVRLVVKGLETAVVSSSIAETSPFEKQFWYSIRPVVDVSVLSPQKTLEWLNTHCGIDVLGPQQFSLDLRAFIFSQIKQIRHQIQASNMLPSKPYLSNYIEWMDWQLKHSDNAILLNETDEALRARILKQGSLGRFFLTVADNAMDVLRGEQDIVQLLFKTNLVEDFYEQQSFGSLYYKKLKKYLEELSHKQPTMNILEVGAGTGSFTQHILSAMSSTGASEETRFNNYFYTDVSPAFFERARERFSTYGHKISFGIFDAELDPSVQGFNERTFDLICASNVLHVTKDLRKTLRGLRKMLKRGGRLLLHEIVRPESVAMGFVFGLLPGWWPKVQDERRVSPVVNETTWDKLMRSAGFSGADLTLRDYAEKDTHLMSIICTTAIEPAETTETRRMTIAIEADSIPQRHLAENLLKRFNAEGIVEPQIIRLSSSTKSLSSELLVTLFDLDAPLLSRLAHDSFESLKAMLTSAQQILWVSFDGNHVLGPALGMIDGFSKVFRIENPKSRFAVLHLDTQADSLEVIVTVLRQCRTATDFDRLEDYKMVDGMLHFDRIQTNTEFKSSIIKKLSGKGVVSQSLQDAKPFMIKLRQLGTSASLHVTIETPTSTELKGDEVEIEVRAVGLNQVDSLISTGQVSDIGCGREIAGTVLRAGGEAPFIPGERVCAYGMNVFKSTARTHHNLVARIPESMTYAEASVLPQDHILAHWISRQAVNVGYDGIILILGAHKQIAQTLFGLLQKSHWRLFMVVPTQQDEKVLHNMPGNIKVSCLSSFTEDFLEAFPLGADVVLDFTGSEISDLIECASYFGRIIRIRTPGMPSTEELQGCSLGKNLSISSLSIEDILRLQYSQLRMPLQIVGTQPWINSGNQFPRLKVHSYKLSTLTNALAALRELGDGDRIAIEFDTEDHISVEKNIQPAYKFDMFASYVIAGGFGDLGRCVAMWMVERGARHLILLSRSGPNTAAAKAMLQALELCGATIHAPLCDVTDYSSLEEELRRCSNAMPPIKGCIQTSAALKDIMYKSMSFEDWNIAIGPKVKGSWNLHSLLPKCMDFFILTSSISGIVGQATQINYAAGNAYQDALAKYRMSLGEKAVSLDLGILETGGLLSQSEDLVKRLMSKNLYTPVTEREILALFDYFCNPALELDQLPAQVVTGIVSPRSHNPQAADFPAAFRHPFWSNTLSASEPSLEMENSADTGINVMASLAQAASAADAADIVTDALAEQFCRILLIPRAKLDIEQPLHTAGADSLCAVDLRNWILKMFAIDVPVFDILGDMPLKVLGNSIAKDSHATQSK